MAEDLITELQRKNDKLSYRIKELEAKLGGNKGESSETSIILVPSIDTAKLQDQIKELSAKLEEKQKELDAKFKIVPGTPNDLIEDLKIQIEKLKNQEKQKSQEISHLKSQCEKFTTEETKSSQTKKDKESLDLERQRLEALQAQFAKEKSSFDAMKVALESTTKITSVDKQHIEKESTELKAKIKKLEVQNVEQTDNLNKLNAEKAQLQNNLAQLQMEMAHKDERFIKLSETLKDEKIRSEEKTITLKAEKDALEKQASALKANFSTMATAGMDIKKEKSQWEQERLEFEKAKNRYLEERQQLDLERQEWEKIKREQGQMMGQKMPSTSKLAEFEPENMEDLQKILLDCETFTHLMRGKPSEKITYQDIESSLAMAQTLFHAFWSSQPQYKILSILQMQGEVTVDQLSKSTGITQAAVLKTCLELAKLNLIKFDVEGRKACKL